jgi:glutaconate CoA-transferase, subunit B
MKKATDFTENEAVTCVLAKMIEESKIYWVVGGGPGRSATLLAQKLYTPDATFILEDGTIAPQPAIPLKGLMQFVSARACYRSAAWTNMNTVCSHASLGLYDYGILSTLQVDPYGNINSTFLGGDYYHPKRRFGGAGGANEIASLCWGTILLTRQEKRKFVKKMDFITSPGFLDGSPGAREKAGLPKGSGPYRVITPEAMFGYDEDTRYMKLLSIAEWVEVKDVLEKMDFEPMIASKVSRMELPTEEELDVLRVHIDPRGQTIGAGNWIHL